VKLERAPSPAVPSARGKSTPAPTSSDQKKGAQFITVAIQYREQLTSLMNTLSVTNPNFVRCILPNHAQRSGFIEADIVMEQLRCNGVLEGIRITRKGFPNRIIFLEFVKRYYLLTKNVPRDPSDPKAQTEVIMKELEIDIERYRIGLSKIFFKAGQLATIEEKREKRIGELILDVQSGVRAWLARNMFYKLTAQSQAAKTIQRGIRARLDLRDWSWYSLFMKSKPLLKVVNFEAQMKEKETAISQLTTSLKKRK